MYGKQSDPSSKWYNVACNVQLVLLHSEEQSADILQQLQQQHFATSKSCEPSWPLLTHLHQLALAHLPSTPVNICLDHTTDPQSNPLQGLRSRSVPRPAADRKYHRRLAASADLPKWRCDHPGLHASQLPAEDARLADGYEVALTSLPALCDRKSRCFNRRYSF